MASANVTSVTVTCTTNSAGTFNIGGSISGLVGAVVLQNNGSDNLSVSGNGSFTFATPIASGGAYIVAVLTQPTGQTCAVVNDAGTVASANITNVAVTCSSAAAGPAVSRVAAGSGHTCTVKADNTVACWGWNLGGQLGDGTKVDRLAPTNVPGLTGVVNIGAGWAHTCALKSNGTVSCWGNAGDGEMGDGQPGVGHVDVLNPQIVPSLTGVVALAVGGYHNCALKSDTSVVCWGLNTFGEIGDGTTIERDSPTTVPGLSGVVALTTGVTNTCAAKSDGTVSCWGDNRLGQLGDGTLVAKLVPTTVPGLTGVVALGAGQDHTCVAKTDGTVACWGYNASGQLGDSATVNKTVPTSIAGFSGVIGLAVDVSFTCALKGNGTVACWGSNLSGALGDGTSIEKHSPAIVPGLAGIVSLSEGSIAGHICAVNSGGVLACWGSDLHGQVGAGNFVAGGIHTPTTVAGLTVLH